MEKFEETGLPLRIAIDISIWQFQIQAGKGGSNPALRTLYYRLLRLLSLSIQPLFIFDGPNKPPFKRNVRTITHAASLPNMLAQQMLKLFGFPFLIAPGEAEAECANLQKEGIVDAVLSEDVDTLMFGCNKSMRNWTGEGTRRKKTPTHVSVYSAESTQRGKSGLDREGMVLIALMSGGDYIPAGIPGCGIKIACEAARAGFGKGLCSLSKEDTVGIRQWKERLQYELRTNESGFFRIKHKALQVPESFPDAAVLGYYTHPVVSSPEKVLQLKGSILWDGIVDIQGMRVFVANAFQWQKMSGAKKFIRGLAPALLTHTLRRIGDESASRDENVEDRAISEANYVEAISGRRTSFITDGTPELRITYVPSAIVALDLDQEEPDTYKAAVIGESDDDTAETGDDNRSRSVSPSKRRAPSNYDPTQPEKGWFPEAFVKYGVPLTVETWEEDMKNPRKFATRKIRERDLATKCGMRKGAMEAFVKVTKPGVERRRIGLKTTVSEMEPITASQLPSVLIPSTTLSKPRGPPIVQGRHEDKPAKIGTSRPRASKPTRAKPQTTSNPQISSSPLPKDSGINPWSLSRRPSDTFGIQLDSTKRYSALGIYGPSEDTQAVNDSPLTANATKSSPLNSPGDNKHSRARSPPSEGVRQVEDQFSDNEDMVDHLDLLVQTSKQAILDERNSKPSPRKRITPSKSIDKLQSSCHLESPNSVSSEKEQSVIGADANSPLEPSTSQKVNRRLDFESPPRPPHSSPTSSSPSLPSPSTLLSSTARSAIPTVPKLALAHNLHSRSDSRGSRKLISLRESLEGAWKEIDQWDVRVKGLANVYQGVEILDLTES